MHIDRWWTLKGTSFTLYACGSGARTHFCAPKRSKGATLSLGRKWNHTWAAAIAFALGKYALNVHSASARNTPERHGGRETSEAEVLLYDMGGGDVLRMPWTENAVAAHPSDISLTECISGCMYISKFGKTSGTRMQLGAATENSF